MKKKVIISLGIIITTIVLTILSVYPFFSPFKLSIEKITFVDISMISPKEGKEGSAAIYDKEKIEDVIQTINNIKASSFWLPGINETPDAEIIAYDEQGELYEFCFHGRLLELFVNKKIQKRVRISYSEYDALAKICEKYGKFD